MNMNHTLRTLNGQSSTELQPLSGMVRNNAGGWSYVVDDWTQLRRFLILGTTGGTFYVGQRELTLTNLDAVERCLSADPARAIATVVEISTSGRAPSEDPALYVLARAASRKVKRTVASKRQGGRLVEIEEPSEASRLALDALPKVARTFTHLAHWIGFVQSGKLRGWGNGFMKGVARWYNEMSAERLGYQVMKYGQRDGVAQRDVYRLCHPARWVTPDQTRRVVFDFIVKGKLPARERLEAAGLRQLAAYGQLFEPGITPAEVAALVREHALPMEAVPTNLRTAEVYEAELAAAGLTWVLRNLGNLAKHGVLTDANPRAVELVCQRLTDQEALAKARVHPLAVLKALCTYRQGHGDKGQASWQPVGKVVDALDSAFYSSFRYTRPSGKRLLLGIDVSGSMWGQSLSAFPSLTAHQGAAVLALAVAHAEQNWSVVKFDTEARPVSISPRQRMDDVVSAIATHRGGGTDLAAPIAYARRNRIPVDAFLLFTDSETWAGSYHLTEELASYRQQMGIAAKVINVAMVANDHTCASPEDAGALEVIGFDANVPSIVSSFLEE